MVFEKLAEIIAKEFKVKASDLKETTRLREDLNVDSLDAVQLIITLEDTFHIQVSDQEAAGLKTVGDIAKFLNSKIK